MHFPLFQIFPLFPRNFLTPWKISQILPFPEKFLNFHPPKFLMTFFSHQPLISNLPLFSLFQYISPYLEKKLFFLPYFKKFSLPVFAKFTCFLHTLGFLVSPYFYHEAFMHHTMHVLDASGHCALHEDMAGLYY